jgi:hypothetical protein
MNITFRCPHCDRVGRIDFDAGTKSIACPECKAEWVIPKGATAKGKPSQCLVCPSTELYLRKDFSQRLGVVIVVVGFVISSIFWYYRMPLWTYAVLFATAMLDLALFLTVGDLLQCYRCQAQYRGIPELQGHEPFNLEMHEKHRQQRIRLEQQAKSS